MNPEIETYARRLEQSECPFMAPLVRLCPNGRLPRSLDEFHKKCQSHVIVTDPDSDKAARLMLEAFGGDVTQLTVALGYHMWLWFEDKDRANEAIVYYNRMPAKMAKFTPEKAATLLQRVRKLRPSKS
jgi:hypothetical protein